MDSNRHGSSPRLEPWTPLRPGVRETRSWDYHFAGNCCWVGYYYGKFDSRPLVQVVATTELGTLCTSGLQLHLAEATRISPLARQALARIKVVTGSATNGSN